MTSTSNKVIDAPHALTLLSSMYLCKPSKEALKGWKDCLASDSSPFLTDLRTAVHAVNTDSNAELEDLLWEYTRLFIGPYKLPCPPWESVYTSPKGLMMQDAAVDVAGIYSEFGLKVEDANVMPDHIGTELNFLAVALEKAETNAGRNEAAEKFLKEHILQWTPRFTRDMEENAETLFYKTVARTTRVILEAI